MQTGGLNPPHPQSKVTPRGMMPESPTRGKLAASADALGPGGEMSRLRPDARRVVKVSYKAVDLIAGIIGGVLAGLIFKTVWGIIQQGDEAPKPTDEQRGWREILLAAGLQGAIFALVKAAIDRGAAEGTRKLTGIWPGDEGQQPGNSA